jgi:hypothetical protein
MKSCFLGPDLVLLFLYIRYKMQSSFLYLLPVYRAYGLGLLEIVKRIQEKATFSAQDLQAYTVRCWSYVVGFFPPTHIPLMQRFWLVRIVWWEAKYGILSILCSSVFHHSKGSNVCKQRNVFLASLFLLKPLFKSKGLVW